MTAKKWNDHYLQNDFPWDLGEPSPIFVKYFENFDGKNQTAIVPGAGRGNDAIFLAQKGFGVTILDVSEKALEIVQERAEELDLKINLVCGDVTNYTFENKFDFWVEHTCFCAIHPTERESYIKTASKNLKPNGTFIGALMSFPLTEEGPPFGGSKEEYLERFEKDFEILKLENNKHFVERRKDREFFILAKLKV